MFKSVAEARRDIRTGDMLLVMHNPIHLWNVSIEGYEGWKSFVKTVERSIVICVVCVAEEESYQSGILSLTFLYDGIMARALLHAKNITKLT